MKHKSNSIDYSKLFGGGEADVRSIVDHNVHENMGRVQEGSTSMLMFGPLIEYLDVSEGGKRNVVGSSWDGSYSPQKHR